MSLSAMKAYIRPGCKVQPGMDDLSGTVQNVDGINYEKKLIITGGKAGVKYFFELDEVELLPTTEQQDRNRIEIYAGDLVLFHSIVYTVKFGPYYGYEIRDDGSKLNHKGNGFYLEPYKDPQMHCLEFAKPDEMEIIGCYFTGGIIQDGGWIVGRN